MGTSSSTEMIIHESFQSLHKNLDSEGKQIVKQAFQEDYDVKLNFVNFF